MKLIIHRQIILASFTRAKIRLEERKNQFLLGGVEMKENSINARVKLTENGNANDLTPIGERNYSVKGESKRRLLNY